MLDEIINKYEHFSDSLVLKFSYSISGISKNVDVIIKCMNKFNDYEFETIKLSFIDLIEVRFIEKVNQSSVFINAALLSNESGIITFDFFPLIFSNSKLEENENSNFKIKCRAVNYKLVDYSN